MGGGFGRLCRGTSAPPRFPSALEELLLNGLEELLRSAADEEGGREMGGETLGLEEVCSEDGCCPNSLYPAERNDSRAMLGVAEDRSETWPPPT